MVTAAERDLVVRLTPDPSALLEFLDTAAGALTTAADTLRAAYPAPAAPVDRTGMCDHCDRPQTGGAAGGGISPEYWCDDHRPADSALDYTDDVDATEPWAPKVGDRVVARSYQFAGPGTVTSVRPHDRIPLAWVTLDRGPTDSLIFYFDELSPEPKPPPLADTLAQAHADWFDGDDDYHRWQTALADAVRDRLAAYPQDTPAVAIYRDWFGVPS